MTTDAPALLAHRDTLAAALAEHARMKDADPWPTCICGFVLDDRSVGTRFEDRWRAHVADALLASGAVRDAATLPDDEALVSAVTDADWAMHAGSMPGDRDDWLTETEQHLTALAAALAPTEEKA